MPKQTNVEQDKPLDTDCWKMWMRCLVTIALLSGYELAVYIQMLDGFQFTLEF